MTVSAISPRLAIRTERKAIARRSVCEYDERHDLADAFFDDVAHNGGDPDRARRIAVHQHALRIELDALARLRREGAIVQELADARLHFFQVANDRARQASIDEAAFVVIGAIGEHLSHGAHTDLPGIFEAETVRRC